MKTPNRAASRICLCLAAAIVPICMAAEAADLKAVLARGVSYGGEPISAGERFLADETGLTVVVQNPGDREVLLQYSVRSAGNDKAGVERTPLYVGEQGWSSARIADKALAPGRYQVELEAGGKPALTLPFEIVPKPPLADLRPPSGAEDAIDIALASLGGAVRVETAGHGGSENARDLNDGFGFTTSRFGYSCESCGWSAPDVALPAEISISFNKKREADVRAVGIDTTTWKSRSDRADIPALIEVLAEVGQGRFERVAEALLRPELREQWIPLTKVKTKEIRLVIRSSHGGDAVRIGEVRVLENPRAGESVLRDMPIDLARPELGGSIVSYTSQADDQSSVQKLVDGDPMTAWASADGTLPQDVVFAMPGDRSALVDRLVVDMPATAGFRPARLAIAVSSAGPRSGFVELGSVTVPRDAAAIEIPVKKEARFLRLRVVEGGSGPKVSLGSTQIIEASQQGYVSALVRKSEPPRLPETAGLWNGPTEREPNDVNGEPISGKGIRGSTSGRDDKDLFALPAAPEDAVLNLTIEGRPYLRNEVELLNQDKRVTKRLSPAELARLGPDLTWRLHGEKFLRVGEPPTGVVVAWDSSEGVAGMAPQIEQAVTRFVTENAGDQAISLMRYGDTPEVIVDGFSRDPERLLAGMAGMFTAGGGRSFFGALDKAADLLERFDGNRVIVVLASGNDTRSVVPAEQLWQRLAKSGVRVYGVGVGSGMNAYHPAFGATPQRVIEHGVSSTGGGAYLAEDAAELASVLDSIGEELRQPSSYALRATLGTSAGSVEVTAQGGEPAAPRAEIVLDASAAMQDRPESAAASRMNVAKAALRRVFRTLPARPAIGLRAYGHRLRTVGKCLDTELLVPVEIASPQNLLREIDRLEPRGASLLARSLEQAIRDLRGGRQHVIAIAGTGEECDDVHAVVGRLVSQDPGIRIDVVGLMVDDPGIEETLRAVSRRASGMYLAANDEQAVEAALKHLLEPRYVLADASGEMVATGAFGEKVSVPPGTYRLRVDAAGTVVERERLVVTRGETLRVALADGPAAELAFAGAAQKSPDIKAKAAARTEASVAPPVATGAAAVAWQQFTPPAGKGAPAEKPQPETRVAAAPPAPPPPPASPVQPVTPAPATSVPALTPPPAATKAQESPRPARPEPPPAEVEAPAAKAESPPAKPAPAQTAAKPAAEPKQPEAPARPDPAAKPAAKPAAPSGVAAARPPPQPSPAAAPRAPEAAVSATAEAVPQRPESASPSQPFTPNVIATMSAPRPPAPPEPRQDDPEVRELQGKLAAMGYDVGPIDGVMGPRTREALAQLRREARLPVEDDLMLVNRQIDTVREMRAAADAVAAATLAALSAPQPEPVAAGERRSASSSLAMAASPREPAPPPAPAPAAVPSPQSPAATAVAPPGPRSAPLAALASPPAGAPRELSADPARPGPVLPGPSGTRPAANAPAPAATPDGPDLSGTYLGPSLAGMVGNAFTPTAVRKMEMTYHFAFDVLPPGRTVDWQDFASNMSGRVHVGGWVEDPQGARRTCRSYRQELTVGSESLRDGTVLVACRSRDGEWVPARTASHAARR